MSHSYEKIRHEPGYGLRINHTFGVSAEGSTLSHLHYTSEFMLFYFIKGAGHFKIEGRQYAVRAGDIVFIRPSEMFLCTIDANTYHERITLHIDESLTRNFSFDCKSLFSPFYRDYKNEKNHIPEDVAKKQGLDILIEILHTNIQKTTAADKAMTVCKTVELLYKLGALFSSQAGEDTSQKENALIRKVLYYLNEHFRENISVSSVAEVFTINTSYLSHLFKLHVGSSVWDYVIFRRIHYFNNLLSKNHTIEEACRQAGFRNYANFYRLYKKHMNMTPQQFKRQLG